MEATRPRPPGVLDAASLPEVAGACAARGPFVTVYLTTEPAVENAGPLAELRWKRLRRDLLEAGAPNEALGAIDPLVPEAHTWGRTLAVVATAGGVQFVHHEAEPPARDVGRMGALPSFGPVLEWEQAAVPHIVVLADRVGADLAALTSAGDERVTSVGPGDGHDPELRRSVPGGWSQRRYQQRAENLWEERAKEVAQELAGLAEEIGARLIVVAGDVRAVQLLEKALPKGVREVVRNVEGSRAADGGLDELAEETVRLAATVAAEDTVACLRRLKEELGREGGLAVEGVEDTLAALAEARVDVLLVHDDPEDDRQAFFGPGANLVATGPSPLVDLAVEKPISARLVDVAIRAALGTSAGVRMVPGVPREGMAALLRY